MEIEYAKDALFNFEIKILTMNKIKGFLPMSISKYDEKLSIIYHEEECNKVNFKMLNNPYKLMNILENVMIVVMDSGNYLIPIERYDLKADLIYINSKLGEIRILFVPVEEGETNDFKNKMLDFISDLPVEHGICRQYIDRVTTKLEEENLTRRGFLNFLGELKRECHICGWDV